MKITVLGLAFVISVTAWHRPTPSLAMALYSTRLRAVMRSNRSGRRNRCTRLPSRHERNCDLDLQPRSADGESSGFTLSALCHSLDYLAERGSGQHLWECARVGECSEYRALG